MEYDGRREEKGSADYGGMGQPSQQHVTSCVKWVGCGIGHERFENSGSVLGGHPGKGYTGGRCSPTL